jgi:23S rRNA (adenine2030-N6)-methyltransferase
MNYRHAFHAGNFGDCMKHALLVWAMLALQRKPTPFAVLDTHAGAGSYDLISGPAERTGEWHDGIERLLHDPPAPLADYVGLVRQVGLYPGSPALIRALLRSTDQLICCELHPEDVRELRRRFAHDRQVAVHHRDAWEALGALLPPRERRGLVLIDPPFEDPQEFERLASGLLTGHARFRNGTFLAWYPIKHRAPVRAFQTAVRQSGIRDVMAAELCLREPIDPVRLNGCGLLLINPPFGFEADAPIILDALLQRLSKGESGASAGLTRLVDE